MHSFPRPARSSLAALALGLVLAGLLTSPSHVCAQRRSRGRSPFVAALIDVVHLDAETAAGIEHRVGPAVHEALGDPRSLPTNIVLRALIAEGRSYVEASARVEELAGADGSSADVMSALTAFFSTGGVVECTLGFSLRVQDCEAARAAVGGPPLDAPWEPGDGHAWAGELVERGVRRPAADRLAAAVSGLMANITRRSGAGTGALALYRACPREGVAAIERRRLWDAGASAEMIHCIADWLTAAGGRDGAVLNLAAAFGLTTANALRLHDFIVAYHAGSTLAWSE